MSYGETLLYVWAHKRQIELFEALVSEQSFPLPPGERMQRERESITADIAKGAVIISTIEEKLAYRTPGLNKPMGHIVLERDQAEQLVTAWRALFGSSS